MTEQSRNSWIVKDDATQVSGRHKDVFEDILDDRRHSSDVLYCLKKLEVPKFKRHTPRSAAEVKKQVLGSDRVQYAIEQTCADTKLSRKEVEEEANEILSVMAHTKRMEAIRCLAVALVKSLKALYQRIYVNGEGIQKVRELATEYPILLMPTHRSYMDFLLMSYVFFHYEITLPSILAAMDFMGMKFFGWLLRNCGAFYIRRNFGDDQLYWSVFTEYVQSQLLTGDSAIEFYVEGTRSRTSKSYSPRLGMLSAALEPYFKAQVADIMIVPCSISYDRILEESLYAYELLGVPKPKESTSGLLKARKILDDDFGNIHIFFGEPISIRKYSDGLVDRSLHSLAPRYIASLTDQEQKLIKRLGHDLVLCHQKNMVVSPWSLMAAILVQTQVGVSVRQLAKEVDWLKKQAANAGAYIDWPANESAESIVRDNVSLHSNVVLITQEDIVEMVRVEPPTHAKATDSLMVTAGQHLMLALYRNHILHVFVRPAIIAVCINACHQDTLSVGDLFNKYAFLEQLLSKDFVFVPGNTRVDFEAALMYLVHSCGVVMEEDHVIIGRSTNKHTTFYSHMFEPFLLGYWVVCQYLLSNQPKVGGKPQAQTQKAMVKEAQMMIAQLLQDNIIRHYEVLSLDLINNGLVALYQMGAMYKERREGVTYMFANTRNLSNITEQLAKLIEVPTLPSISINLHAKTVTVNAKM